MNELIELLNRNLRDLNAHLGLNPNYAAEDQRLKTIIQFFINNPYPEYSKLLEIKTENLLEYLYYESLEYDVETPEDMDSLCSWIINNKLPYQQ